MCGSNLVHSCSTAPNEQNILRSQRNKNVNRRPSLVARRRCLVTHTFSVGSVLHQQIRVSDASGPGGGRRRTDNGTLWGDDEEGPGVVLSDGCAEVFRHVGLETGENCELLGLSRPWVLIFMTTDHPKCYTSFDICIRVGPGGDQPCLPVYLEPLRDQLWVAVAALQLGAWCAPPPVPLPVS